MKINLILILAILSQNINAQLLFYTYNGIEDKTLERQLYLDSNNHPSIKPYAISFNSWQKIDSTHPLIQKKNLITFIKPIINLDFNQDINQFHQVGLDWYSIIGKKISSQISLSQFIVRPDSNLINTIDSVGILPHYGKFNENNNSLLLRTHLEGSLMWQTFPYLSFRLGIGNHFLGNGYHSLFLSENSSPYPFIQGNAKIWKVNYIVIYSFYNEPTWNYFNLNYNRKNSTLHYLSWNVSKRFSFNAFETVIWQVYDSIGYRGFDVNYVNPIIFFRPLEFSLGSPDNVIMGGGFRYRIFKNTHMYGQLLLDEFKLSEIKAKSGWWGNKFGIQAGIKTYQLFKSNHWFALLECNAVRPFTYSHSDYLSNWGNMHEPLAHPLGANFIEWIGQSSYYFKNWTFAIQYIYQRQGRSNYQFNAGDNIYVSYLKNRNEYGNYMLVGSNYETKNIDFNIYYLLKKSWHLRMYIRTGVLKRVINYVELPKKFYFHVGFLSKIK